MKLRNKNHHRAAGRQRQKHMLMLNNVMLTISRRLRLVNVISKRYIYIYKKMKTCNCNIIQKKQIERFDTQKILFH